MSKRDLILVVDDSRIIRNRLESILIRSGFDVILREDGEEAILAALEYYPDLILMDYNMSEMDGIQAARVLKGYSQTRMIPIAVFTDTRNIEEKVRSFKVGIEDYILKNVAESELVARVRGLLNWKKDREKIVREKQKLEGLLDNLSDAIIIVDNSGLLVFFNRRAAERFKLIPELIMGKRLKELLPNLENMEDIFSAVQERRETENVEVVIDHEDGKRIYDVRVRRVHLGFTEDIGGAVIFSDITAEKETEKLRSEFYSMVAHEMRTPISVVLGYTQLILEGNAGELTELQREFLGGVEEKGRALRKLVDDFLEVSRLKNKFIILDKKGFDFTELVAKTVEGLRLLAENKNINLGCDCKEGKIDLFGDSDKLEHVLINIIENAIKYTGEGGEVHLECYSKDDGVEVKVSDTGIGMSEEEMESIFDSFTRLKDAEKKKIKGTGLGLTIVKDIVTAHNGNVSVESRESEGSTFYIWLPGLLEDMPDKKNEDSTAAANITQ